MNFIQKTMTKTKSKFALKINTTMLPYLDWGSDPWFPGPWDMLTSCVGGVLLHQASSG